MSKLARRMLPQSLPDQIADWLITEISEERLAPGQRVTEQFVADQCHVSRGPVRDAFRMVEKLGLVRLLPRRGVVVSPLDLDELRELFDIRTALTRVATGQVINKASDQQLLDLAEAARNLWSMVEDEASYFAASNVLAETFMNLANSQKLRELMLPIHLQILRYRHHGFSSMEARRVSAEGFLKITEAMITREEQLALDTLDKSSAKLAIEVFKAFKT